MRWALPFLSGCAIACTPFLGQPSDAAALADLSSIDDVATDAAPPEARCAMRSLSVGRPQRLTSGAPLSPRITTMAIAWHDAQALLVTADDARHRVTARRLDVHSAPVNASERVVLFERAPDSPEIAVVPHPAGWVVYTRAGAVWIDAEGRVAHRVVFRASTPRVGLAWPFALDWAGDRLRGLHVRYTETPGEGTSCDIVPVDYFDDGRTVVSKPLYHGSFCQMATGGFDPRGGEFLVHDDLWTRVRFDASGGLRSSDSLGALSEDSTIQASTLAATGEHVWLVRRGARFQVMWLDQIRPRLGPVFTDDFAGRVVQFASTPQGFVVGLADRSSAQDRLLSVLRLDASGAVIVGADRVLAEGFALPADQSAAPFAVTSGEAGVLAAWMVPEPGLPPALRAMSVFAPGSVAQRVESFEGALGLVTEFGLVRGAMTFATIGASAVRVGDDGAPLGEPFALSERVPIGVDDELWALRADADLRLLRLDAQGALRRSVQLSPDGANARQHAYQLVQTDDGVGMIGSDPPGEPYFVEWLSREGLARTSPAALPRLAEEYVGFGSSLQTIAGRGGSFLMVGVELLGGSNRFGLLGVNRALRPIQATTQALEGALLGGWATGAERWVIATPSGLWRLDASGLTRSEVSFPDDMTAMAGAASGCAAMVAVRRAYEGTALSFFSGEAAGALQSTARLPIDAEGGMSAISLPGGRFLLAVSGVDPAEPARPGLFVFEVHSQ